MEQYIPKSALVAEIQRLQDLTMDENKNFYSEAAEGEYNALCNIEHFIDSLQEEPVSEGKDIFDNCLKSEEKFILPQKISGNIDCENCLYSSACALGDIQACIIDKPVSEDLEVPCNHCQGFNDKEKCDELVFGRNCPIIKKPVNEDLEEAAKNHAAERYRTTRDRELAEKCKWSFISGAKWYKKHNNKK